MQSNDETQKSIENEQKVLEDKSEKAKLIVTKEDIVNDGITAADDNNIKEINGKPLIEDSTEAAEAKPSNDDSNIKDVHSLPKSPIVDSSDNKSSLNIENKLPPIDNNSLTANQESNSLTKPSFFGSLFRWKSKPETKEESPANLIAAPVNQREPMKLQLSKATYANHSCGYVQNVSFYVNLDSLNDPNMTRYKTDSVIINPSLFTSSQSEEKEVFFESYTSPKIESLRDGKSHRSGRSERSGRPMRGIITKEPLPLPLPLQDTDTGHRSQENPADNEILSTHSQHSNQSHRTKKSDESQRSKHSFGSHLSNHSQRS